MKKRRDANGKCVEIKPPLKERFAKDILLNWRLYVLLLPGFISLVLFKLLPVGGMVIAFQNYSAFLGIRGSEWVWFDNFKRMFTDPYMLALIKNTVILAVLSVICVFPFPVIFSLFLNEVRFINSIIAKLGGQSINFMARPEWFRPIYIFLQIWQTLGYSAVIYMAGISAINMELYEAAEVDGCGRWGKMFHVTLPGISTSVITMLIISIGNIFTVDTDRILLLYNASNASTSDVIQSYVYRIAFQSIGFPDYSYGTAVNIVKSVIAFILVIIANKLADKYAETRLF